LHYDIAIPNGLAFLKTDMKAKSKKTARNFEYPDVTPGSIAARKLRAEANSLDDTERQKLFAAEMEIFYGGTAKKTAGHRH
jgi:hypothetical protein